MIDGDVRAALGRRTILVTGGAGFVGSAVCRLPRDATEPSAGSSTSTLITNCGNNYGPSQFPEKFIPTLIICALRAQELPIYGGGTNVRDWIHVEDHARALLGILAFGAVGGKYLLDLQLPQVDVALVGLHMVAGFEPGIVRAGIKPGIAGAKRLGARRCPPRCQPSPECAV